MSDTSRTKPIDWSLIDHHLQAGAYEAAAAALWEAQLASAQADDAVTAATLAAVRQICLACHECRTKIAWHQQAILESEQREAELYSHAQALLTQISQSTLPEATDITLGNSVSVKPDQPTTLPTSHHPTGDAAGPLSDTGSVTIWTRVLLFLHNLWRQMGLLSDTSPEAQSTFGPQLVSTSETESEQVVEAWSIPSIPVVRMDDVAEDRVDSPVDDSGDDIMNNTVNDTAVVEAQPPFVSLLADAPLELLVATTTERIAKATDESADPLTVEFTVELTEEPTIALTEEPTVESTIESTVGLSDDTTKAEIVSVAEDELPDKPTAPSLVIHCLGTFQVYQDDQLIEEWSSNKGQMVFKYLVTHRDRPVAKEVLMDLFWPNANPDAARNNLNVAIYGLRRALRQGRPEYSHVQFQEDRYLFNPALQIWVDAEAFEQHMRCGQRLAENGDTEQAMREYRAAVALYRGEFFEEDRYEDWLLARRQSLQNNYVSLLDRLSHYYFEQEDYDACIEMASKMLLVDACHEDAHRCLMRCYNRQGHHHLALRQYHLCVEALVRELDVEPSQQTKELYARIRRQ